MLRRVIPLSTVLLIVLLFGSSSISIGADPVARATEDPDFTGKIIYFEVKEVSHAMYMEGVKVRHVGGRAFLVGKYAKHPDIGEFPDVVYWIPVDQVRVLMEFKNMEDAKKASSMRKNVDR